MLHRFTCHDTSTRSLDLTAGNCADSLVVILPGRVNAQDKAKAEAKNEKKLRRSRSPKMKRKPRPRQQLKPGRSRKRNR